MKIRWFGHAFFEVTSEEGSKVAMDPFDESVGYPMPNISSHVVTLSHEHYDHSGVHIVNGDPVVIKGPGLHRAAGFTILGIPSFHDEVQGAKRGMNTIFVFQVDGITLAHLGDLGHTLGPDKVKEMGRVDILLIPVGGTYTIDAYGANEVIDSIGPKAVIPMHYKTGALSFPLASLDEFIEGKERVRRVGHIWDVDLKDLEATEPFIAVMDYT